jgi:alpha-galactosidase
MRKKLVLIGAGSVSFTKGLVLDLLRNQGGEKWHLALVDVDSRALDSISKLCRKILTAQESDIELSCSTDRCDLLPGADFVVTTIAVGGRRAWEQDVFIPREYGIYQPVGDSVMPGGISRAMRMIPAMLDIIQDIYRICPKAYFFNYANPMNYICRAIRKKTDFPVTGLCHGVFDTQNYLAEFSGLEKEKTTALAVGVNHLTFIYDFRSDGKNAWPFVRKKLKEQEFDSTRNPFSWEIFSSYNAFPAPGDRHVTEFFPERFPGGRYYGKSLGIDVFSFEDEIKYGNKKYENMEKMAQSSEPLPKEFFEHLPGEHEQLMNIIHSIMRDSRKVFSVNMPNRGVASSLPYDAVLELPAAATARGFIPVQIRDFPDNLTALLAKPLAIAELVVDAALKGDRKLFIEAVLMGGYIEDRTAVTKMVDELIKAHIQYLPQFR